MGLFPAITLLISVACLFYEIDKRKKWRLSANCYRVEKKRTTNKLKIILTINYEVIKIIYYCFSKRYFTNCSSIKQSLR